MGIVWTVHNRKLKLSGRVIGIMLTYFKRFFILGVSVLGSAWRLTISEGYRGYIRHRAWGCGRYDFVWQARGGGDDYAE